MASLLSAANLAHQPIADGDAGIILRANGSFEIFNTHKGMTAENMTDAQKEQGSILLALSAALVLPPLMAILKDASTDPQIFETNLDTGRPN